MKRFTVILVLLTYLLGATDANQLLKVPFMVKHYIKHLQQNPSLSVAGFINMHYINPIIDDDIAQDMQLPFKKHSADNCMISAISMPFQKMEVEAPAIPLPPITFSSLEENDYVFLPMTAIFQPPRVDA